MDPVLILGATFGLLAAAGLAFRAFGLAKPARPRPRDEKTRERLRLALQAAAGGRDVRVESYTETTSHQEDESGWRLVVTGLCPEIHVWRPEPGRGARSFGDPDFEGVVGANGPNALVLALFDAECRQAFRALLRGGIRTGRLSVASGELEVHVPTTGFANAHPGLGQAAHAVGLLARKLETPPDVCARLAANATRDPCPRTRLENLEALVRGYASDPRTHGAVRQALADVNEWVRLRAARAAGSAGREALVDLALSSTTEDACSAQAIEALAEDLPLDRLDPLVARAAAKPPLGRPETTYALIAALRRSADGRALDVLGRLARRAHDAYATDVVYAMTAVPRAGIEGALLGAMAGLDAGPRLAEAAARRLGEVGTADAVVPLQHAAERHGGAVAATARQSIAAIQSRLSGSPGELALADGDAGQLSLASDAGGRVTLPSPEPDEPGTDR